MVRSVLRNFIIWSYPVGWESQRVQTNSFNEFLFVVKMVDRHLVP